MSPHDLIKAAMTGLKKPRAPHHPARTQQSTPTKQPAAPAHPGTPHPTGALAGPPRAGTRQVPANPDRDDGRSTGAHLQW